MPCYSYTNANGDTVERYFKASEMPERITLNGESYERDLGSDLKSVQAMRSISTAPSRVPPKWDPHFKNHTPEGWCIPRNRSEINAYARDNGLVKGD